MTSISEKTRVSLSLVIMVVAGLVPFAFVAFQGSGNAKAIDEIKIKQEKIDGIATDIAVIKNKLDNIEQKLQQRKGN